MNPSKHDWSLPHVAAHRASSNHRAELEVSEMAGCFYCRQIFPPTEIVEWIDEVDDLGTTALCPRCGIDSVIGSASVSPITLELLERMNGYWF